MPLPLTALRSAAPPAGQQAVLLGAAATALGLALWLSQDTLRPALLLGIGVLLGISLYHGAFGFTSAWRRALVDRDLAGVQAQLIMIGLAMVLFAPLLTFGHARSGAVAPAGLQVAFGSFLFGLGMQLGGGCGSGTLFTVGGGDARMVVTLAAFCAGAFLGSLDMARYADWPSLGAVSLMRAWGAWPALIVQAAILLAVGLGFRMWAKDAPQSPLWTGFDRTRLLRGPWPLLFAGAMLACLNALTLVLAGHPWTITWAFTLWGAEVAQAVGWDPATSAFWSGGFPARALEAGILADTTSLMDIGIILGALIAAAAAGRVKPSLRISPRSLAAAILGGLLMGYGARLAYGCNIGAFFSGIASFSLHGWLWIVAAVVGTVIGIRLRPVFGLRN